MSSYIDVTLLGFEFGLHLQTRHKSDVPVSHCWGCLSGRCCTIGLKIYTVLLGENLHFFYLIPNEFYIICFYYRFLMTTAVEIRRISSAFFIRGKLRALCEFVWQWILVVFWPEYLSFFLFMAFVWGKSYACLDEGRGWTHEQEIRYLSQSI